MPGRNRTGPTGEGPRTGRGLGGCSGSQVQVATSEVQGGLGMGRGRGGGGRGGMGRGGMGRGGGGRGRQGNRNMFHATGMTGWQRAAADSSVGQSESSTEVVRAERDEVAILSEQATELSRTLVDIQSRLAAIEGKPEMPVSDSSPDT